MSNDSQADDARLTLPALEFLRTPEGASLRQQAAALDDPSHPSVAQIATLRKTFSADTVHAALVLAAIQPKARKKFPDLPYCWSPPEALEQATGTRVARHKATRFALAAQAGHPLFDLCAGIGGDALYLAEIAPVTAVERSPIRTACLRWNAEEMRRDPHSPIVQQVDIRDMLPALPSNAILHIDPARRSAGKRSPQYADLIPGPDLLEPLLKRAAGAALKLSPAVDFESLPPGHIELISDAGTVVQAILYSGILSFAPPSLRTATIIDEHVAPFSFTAAPSPATVYPLPSPTGLHHSESLCLYELDGTLTRASLAQPFTDAHGLRALTPDGGYAFSTTPDHAQHPALTGFRVLGKFPFNEAHIAQQLALLPPTQHHTVEVKSRGRLPGAETDHLQVAWSKAANASCTVLLYRDEEGVQAVLAERLPASPRKQ